LGCVDRIPIIGGRLGEIFASDTPKDLGLAISLQYIVWWSVFNLDKNKRFVGDILRLFHPNMA
jgi:hypothetical protein